MAGDRFAGFTDLICVMEEEVLDTQNIDDTEMIEYEEKNVLNLNIHNFNGPLDLLLRLVKDAKIEIKDIFVSEVTNQFLLYLSQMDQLDVDKASEYMTIAAELMEIKSYKMLPVLADFADIDDDPEKLFIRKLEEYKMLREAADELKTIENPDRLFKEPSAQAGEYRYCVKDLSLDNLLNAFANILNKVEIREQDKNTVRAINKENFSVKDKMLFIREKLTENESISFLDLFKKTSTKNEIVVTFFAALELTKLQIIKTEQKVEFGDIILIRNFDEGEEIDIEYEDAG